MKTFILFIIIISTETVENSKKIKVICKAGEQTSILNYDTPMEKCNLNLGDYFSDPEV